MVNRTRRPGARAARVGLVAAPIAGLAVAVLLVWQASYAAFSVTTTNGANNWAAGTVALTDNDSNVALFNATKLRPGSTGSRCIVVTSTGTVPSTVKLYGAGLATTNALSSSLSLQINQGSGTAADCTDFTSQGAVYNNTLAAFTATTFAGGYATSWAPSGSGSESRTFQFVYTLDAAAPNSTQGGTATVTFTWEAQS
jgi:hypothetical protein